MLFDFIIVSWLMLVSCCKTVNGSGPTYLKACLNPLNEVGKDLALLGRGWGMIHSVSIGNIKCQ